MNYTDGQFAALAPFARHFRTAVESRWARNPGREGLRIIGETYNAATGSRERWDTNCGTCVLRLLTEAGALWLEDERARAAMDAVNDAECVRMSEEAERS